MSGVTGAVGDAAARARDDREAARAGRGDVFGLDALDDGQRRRLGRQPRAGTTRRGRARPPPRTARRARRCAPSPPSARSSARRKTNGRKPTPWTVPSTRTWTRRVNRRARAARGRRWPAPPGCAGCAGSGATTTWSARPSCGDRPAVVAHERDRRQAAPARLAQRLEHAARRAAGGQREQRVAAAAVGDDLAGEHRVGPDVVGDRGEDRRVLAEVERRVRRPAAQRRAEVGHDVHRVGRRAAVAERQQAPAAVERRRAARAAAASERGVAGGQRLLAQRADLLGLHQDGAAHVGEHGVEVVLALGQERVEEGRGAGVVPLPRLAALEQAAVLEEDVHELPQHVVERLHELLGDERVLGRRRERPLGRVALEGDRQAAALARQAQRPPARSRRRSRRPRARPAARAARPGRRPPRPARWRAARACRR